jgi:hypothetical protein
MSLDKLMSLATFAEHLSSSSCVKDLVTVKDLLEGTLQKVEAKLLRTNMILANLRLLHAIQGVFVCNDGLKYYDYVKAYAFSKRRIYLLTKRDLDKQCNTYKWVSVTEDEMKCGVHVSDEDWLHWDDVENKFVIR